jgi:uncharacterized protein YabE (DUF348 family)
MRYQLRRLHRRLKSSQNPHVRRLHAASRHPFAVPVAAFVALAMVALSVGVVLMHNGASLEPDGNNIVIISHDHQTQIVPSHEPTVRALLAKLSIDIHPGDVVEPDLDTPIHQDDFRVNIYRASPVQIVDGGHVGLSFSAATTPLSVARQTGKRIYPEDSVSSAPVDNFLSQHAIGSVVTIKRSVPVTIDINGFPASTRTLAATVGAFLHEKHIEIGATGKVSPAPATRLKTGQTIYVVRDGTGIRSLTQIIPMPVHVIYDSSLAYGTSAVRQAGTAGRKVLTYRIVVKGGKVISKKLIQSVVTEDAVTQIVVEGTNLSGIKGDMALAGIPASQYQYADYIISHESGWCPTKWQGEIGYCPPSYQAIHNINGPDDGYTHGYGLCQSTPAGKMASAGADWATNPITQLKWCTSYANARYGNWHNAYQYWIVHHNW